MRNPAQTIGNLGVTDPDYCVLRFTAHSDRYYHDFKSENFEV